MPLAPICWRMWRMSPGLIAAGVYPNPVGIADVVSFTTHKTLNGPRGAVLITHRRDLSRKLDRAVFPGEQGGPHINAMAGLAVALRLATTDAVSGPASERPWSMPSAWPPGLTERGFGKCPTAARTRILLLLDCKSVPSGADGTNAKRRHGRAHPRPGRRRRQSANDSQAMRRRCAPAASALELLGSRSAASAKAKSTSSAISSLMCWTPACPSA